MEECVVHSLRVLLAVRLERGDGNGERVTGMGRGFVRAYLVYWRNGKGGKECDKEAAADVPRSFSSEQSQSQSCSLRHLMFALGIHHTVNRY